MSISEMKATIERLIRENEILKSRNMAMIQTILDQDKNYQDLIEAHKIRLDTVYRLTRDI